MGQWLKTASGRLIELTSATMSRSNLGTPMVAGFEVCSKADADKVMAGIEAALLAGGRLISVPRILAEIAEAPDKLHGG